MDKDFVKKQIQKKEKEYKEGGLAYKDSQRVADMKKAILEMMKKGARKSDG